MQRRTLLTLVLLGMISTTALADPPGGRLQRIKDSGILVIAHGETGVPFSYVDRTGPAGFGVDISKHVADEIRKQVGLNEIKIRWNPVTLSTRFPMIVTNTVDLECITTTNTRARQQLVAFSNTFYISDEGIATRRDSGIKGYPDLAGKRVAVVRNTSTERALLARGINLTLLPERSHLRAVKALSDQRADAYVQSASIIAGGLLGLKDSTLFHIVGSGGYKEAFGCVLPKDDAAFKKVVDQALASLMTSGEMERLYNKWFMSSIPPHGRNVGFPLSEENRRLYAAPNDIPFE